ncbi:hypothetical protein EYR36_010050 [Pleurotus pulmonarius]|nr:hypothetical protein EYR36_010050 [Pleurotus pulmonarius]
MAKCFYCQKKVSEGGLSKHMVQCANKQREQAPRHKPTLPEPIIEMPTVVEDLMVPDPMVVDAPRRSKRGKRRLPARYREPSPVPQIEPVDLQGLVDVDNTLGGHPLPFDTSGAMFCTKTDNFGVYRVYPRRPTHDPDRFLSSSDLYDPSIQPVNENDVDIPPAPELSPASDPQLTSERDSPWRPFKSPSVARLMAWMYNGSSQKSIAELDTLVHDVILKDDFNPTDLHNFSTKREHNHLDAGFDAAAASMDASSVVFASSSGWEATTLRLRLPKGKNKVPESRAPEYEVHGVYLRPLLAVMKEAFGGAAFNTFHIVPFERSWSPHPATHPAVREPFKNVPPRHQTLYSEIYNCPRMMEDYRNLPTDARYECIIAAFLFWSDSTHLASFGTASLWPLYTFFGNQSKYIRVTPSINSCYHQAYIPKLADDINEVYTEIFGSPPTAPVLTHLKRELMHAVWDKLLSDEFINAYEHGILVQCYDGVQRRIFPRIYTYAADYPEKILLATIRYLGKYPCPRCLIPKSEIYKMGMSRDITFRRTHRRKDSTSIQKLIETVRKYMYNKGLLVHGSAVDSVLKHQSLVPTRNAFAKLYPLGFNYYSIFLPDLLHELELGVWKAVFMHLIRMLHFIGPTAVAALNSRYRRVPTFSAGTIRRFHNDAAAMKKLAGRDYEDLLQCSIPAFEGLFLDDADNLAITHLLFVLCDWHSLAKLRLHTNTTLESLSAATRNLGRALRDFTDKVCPKYATKELPKETEARSRREQAAAGKQKKAQPGTPNPKLFNLTTYKLHALGDYVEAIKQYGTSESWSTQIGELEHRRVKRYYARTNKNDYTRQIAKLERRQRILRALRDRLNTKGRSQSPDNTEQTNKHYKISSSKKKRINLDEFLLEYRDDPAVETFIPTLKAHLLTRLLNLPYGGDEHVFTTEELAKVIIINDNVFEHQTLAINYTTYDMRRAQDLLNPRTNADFMVSSYDDSNTDTDMAQFWYGRIIAIFDAHILFDGTTTKMDFIWVQWFGQDPDWTSSWSEKQIPRIGFVTKDEEDPHYGHCFGFLDPNNIIRAVHIIPAFVFGPTNSDKVFLPPSLVRDPLDKDKDWINYYVDIFADRDMSMRYRGGAIGHTATHRVLPTSRETTPQAATDDDDEDIPDWDRTHSGIDVEVIDLEELDPDNDISEAEGEQESDVSEDSEGEAEDEVEDETEGFLYAGDL